MQLSPPAGADPPPQVEARTDQHHQIAGDDPGAGERRPVVHRERDRDPAQPWLQPGVPQQRQTVDADRRQRGQRDVLVQPHHGALPARSGDRAGRHGQAHQDRQRYQHECDDAGRAADQPPQVVERLSSHAR
jgi:hypothetical protein